MVMKEVIGATEIGIATDYLLLQRSKDGML